MARNAALEKSMGRPRRKPVAVIAHVAFRGVPVRLLIAAHTRYNGTPPSLENDHSILRKHITALMKTSLSYLQRAVSSLTKSASDVEPGMHRQFAMHALSGSNSPNDRLLIHAR